MEVLGWLALVTVVLFVFFFVRHLYRVKTHPSYRFQARQIVQDHEMKERLAELHKSENPRVRDLARKLDQRDDV
jgi:hypothetical protein